MATLGGPAEISFRNFTIPASILSEVTSTFAEGTRERTTLSGTYSRGSGTLDTAEVTATLYVPSMDWLGKNILRSKYNSGTGSLPGNIIWNSDNCATLDVGPVNIHYTCEDEDVNDVYIYEAQLMVNLEMSYTAIDDQSVQLTFHAQPDENGNVFRLGTGNLTAASSYDATTQATVINA